MARRSSIDTGSPAGVRQSPALKAIMKRCSQDLGSSFLALILQRLEILDKVHHSLIMERKSSRRNSLNGNAKASKAADGNGRGELYNTISATTDFMASMQSRRAERSRVLMTVFHGLSSTCGPLVAVVCMVLGLFYFENRVHLNGSCEDDGMDGTTNFSSYISPWPQQPMRDVLYRYLAACITGFKFQFDEDCRMCRTGAWIKLLQSSGYSGLATASAAEPASNDDREAYDLYVLQAGIAAMTREETDFAFEIGFRYWIEPEEYVRFERGIWRHLERSSDGIDLVGMVADGEQVPWLRPSLIVAAHGSDTANVNPLDLFTCGPPIRTSMDLDGNSDAMALRRRRRSLPFAAAPTSADTISSASAPQPGVGRRTSTFASPSQDMGQSTQKLAQTQSQALTALSHQHRPQLLSPRASAALYEAAMREQAALARFAGENYWATLARCLQKRALARLSLPTFPLASPSASETAFPSAQAAPSCSSWTSPASPASANSPGPDPELLGLQAWGDLSHRTADSHWSLMMKWAQSLYWISMANATQEPQWTGHKRAASEGRLVVTAKQAAEQRGLVIEPWGADVPPPGPAPTTNSRAKRRRVDPVAVAAG
ncbi:hypothetical protein DFS34DRAFT_621845 [Phlyctochytrium arcticum]|nr:hypothetical protein DFS34DRAFT_621845 [Phlyctochytrium arcticum]